MKGKKFEITGGNVTVTSKWMPKPHVEFVIDNEVLNLCDLLVELNHPCPLHPVNYVFIYQLTITSEIPKVIIITNANYILPALILFFNCRGCMKFMHLPKIRMVMKCFALMQTSL